MMQTVWQPFAALPVSLGAVGLHPRKGHCDDGDILFGLGHGDHCQEHREWLAQVSCDDDDNLSALRIRAGEAHLALHGRLKPVKPILPTEQHLTALARDWRPMQRDGDPGRGIHA